MAMRCSIKYMAVLCASLALPGAGLAEYSVSENPTIPEVKPSDTIEVGRIPDFIYLRHLNDPDDIVWDRIPSYRTSLTVAPPVHPSTQLRFDADRGTTLYFQLARSADRFYVRLRWKDTTRNVSTTVDRSRDAAAIQFALDGSTDTSYIMGSGPDKPVNIWYWRSDHENVVENLAAGGFGSTTMLPDQPVSGDVTYINGRNPVDREWHLVMSREIGSEGDHQIDLNKDQIPFGFAVWQGNDGERDGNKRVVQGWILLDNTLVSDNGRSQDKAQASAQMSNQ